MTTDEVNADGATEKDGTFLVTAADEGSAVLKDVTDGQVHALSSNPGVERHDAVEGVVASDPPLNVSWRLVEIRERRALSVEESAESPTATTKGIAAERDAGDLTRRPRAGTGEIHVITVPEGTTERAVRDVLDDEEGLLARAARLGVSRVEIRSAPGVVSVRYMP
ncbi:DUF5812 family protein [Halegenticoccus soli]|uniref:DUF5812 family protein n=1 Tax=Halegenticoccus soli TaxID=1985678 RepID=UPI000C6E670C|nr:DUF5812 family protein [Halegenticoccus soli]